jgi:hypothetical protein
MRFLKFGQVAGLGLAAALAAGLAPSAARATVLFTGAGTNAETGDSVSGAVSFSVSGNTLTVMLTNTTPGGTTTRGDVLQGVSWDVDGTGPVLGFPTVALTSPGSATADDRIFTDKTNANISDPLDGYTNALGATPIGEYGISSTGFNGAFAAGTIPLGTGGTDYGIVAAGTFPSPPGAGVNGFSGSAFPLIQKSLTFTLTGATGLSESSITNVQLLFGTDGTGVIPAAVVPEPASLAMLAAGLPLALLALRRRFSRS